MSRVFQIVLRAGKDQKFCWGGTFYWVMGAWGEVILIIQTLFKAKNNFLERIWCEEGGSLLGRVFFSGWLGEGWGWVGGRRESRFSTDGRGTHPSNPFPPVGKTLVPHSNKSSKFNQFFQNDERYIWTFSHCKKKNLRETFDRNANLFD